jgi:hypothetical protein
MTLTRRTGSLTHTSCHPGSALRTSPVQPRPQCRRQEIMASEASRPLLLPQNRRIRHLQGILLRNLTVSRPRGRTIDDAALNKTPQKLEALREALNEPQLPHAQSSDNLSAQVRPTGMRRRRSTVWASQNPSYRQKKLEDVIDHGMVDTFYSLHCAGVEEPIYISEVVEKTMVSGRCLAYCTSTLQAWAVVLHILISARTPIFNHSISPTMDRPLHANQGSQLKFGSNDETFLYSSSMMLTLAH